MALYLLDRTWQFQVNVAIAAQATILATARLTMRTWKNAMRGLGAWTNSAGAATASTGNWAVLGSSNSLVAALDGVDRWVVDADLVWAAGNRSWIVLSQPGIPNTPNPYQVCFDLNSATVSVCTIVISPSAGFTGGAIGARPTATDEIVLYPATSWGVSAANAAQVIHMLKTADGSSFRFYIGRSGFSCGTTWFELPIEPVTGWTNPCLTYGFSSNLTAPAVTQLTFGNLYGTARALGRGASNMAMFLTAEGSRTGLIGELQTFPNDLSLRFPLYPLGLNCTVAPNRGRHGALADAYSPVSGQPEGARYPNAADPPAGQFAQFGSTVVPWNRTPVNLGAAAAGTFPVYFPTLGARDEGGAGAISQLLSPRQRAYNLG